MKDLATNSTWIQLQTLNLSDNFIDAKQAKNLAENTTWIYLQTLNLQHNKIRTMAAKYLASNNTWTRLQTLDLLANSISAEGMNILQQIPCVHISRLSFNQATKLVHKERSI